MPASVEEKPQADEFDLPPPPGAGDIALPSTGTITANGQTIEWQNPGGGTTSVQITGTWTGTLQFEATNDPVNGTWISVFAYNLATASQVSSTTANGNFLIPGGWIKFRLRASAAITGTVVPWIFAVDADLVINTMGATVTAVGGKSNNSAAPGSTNMGVLPAVANAADPTWTEGNQVSESVDLRGRQRAIASGYTTVVTAGTLTRPANTTAYTAGDEITDNGGAIITLTNAARFSGSSGVIQGLAITFSDNWATKPSLEVWVFDTTSTPQTDNAAFAPSDGVVDTCIGVIPVSVAYVGDATGSTGNQVMDSGQISLPFLTVGSANLFLRFVVRNAAQAGTNSGTMKVRARILQD